MIVLSLFDGISCGRLALERAGIPIDKYYASEVDKYAISITMKNYPDTIQIGDVKTVKAEDLPKIDLLIGGSPCQDLSIAKNNRQGLDGERSSLFWHYVRLFKSCKPKYFLLENVASMPNEAKELITKELGVEPIMLNSALVSAQQRKRLYWTNIPNVIPPQDKGIVLKSILESGTKMVGVLDKSLSLLARDYKGFGNQDMTGVLEPIRIGQLDGLSKGQANRIYSVYGKSVCLNANGGGGGAKTGLYKINLPDGTYVVRNLTPIECERLQTLPDNYTKFGINKGKEVIISNTQRYKCLGNGWTVDIIAHIFKNIKDSK